MWWGWPWRKAFFPRVRWFRFVLAGCVALSLLAVCPVLGEEWDCTIESGTFDRSTSCTMEDEVALGGDLTVTGNETKLGGYLLSAALPL